MNEYAQWQTIVDQLRSENKIEFDTPLTDKEVEQIQEQYGFHFPIDLREFLQTALPVSKGFPNWRSDPEDSLRKRLQAPLEGILFDVEHNQFWQQAWGPRPESLANALSRASQLVAEAPTLIPVYSHRMIPDRPSSQGNPVFSVHQTDIIWYGTDLRDYFIHEFFTDASRIHCWPIPNDLRSIEFWDIQSFQDRRWDKNGMARFDNRAGVLPKTNESDEK